MTLCGLPNYASIFSLLADGERYLTAGIFIMVNLKACYREICYIYWSSHKKLKIYFCDFLKFADGLYEFLEELIFEEVELLNKICIF